jgi:ubiquinone/menaquinone biosynthesis C-methylase UbiE
MKTHDPVHAYYENIAAEYDLHRFGNSYGAFVHQQEDAFVKNWLEKGPKNKVLNLGCGTGRFMEYATDGLDFSENMLQVAKQKYPNCQFHHADARTTQLAANSFDALLCLHVLMHQDKAASAQMLDECFRILKPGGLLIVDFPSAPRRKLMGHEPDGWHGANAYSLAEFQDLIIGKYKLEETVGILFFPLHRFPISLRKFIYPLDKTLCRSPLLELSSYLMLALRRC